MNRVAALVCTSLWLFAVPCWAAPAVKEVPSVWGSAVVSANMTDAQAKRAALDDARALAIEQAAGVRVDAAALYGSGLERAHFLQTLSHGYIVEEEQLEWALDSFREKLSDPPIPHYRVHIRALVAIPPQPQTPGFSVKAQLNRTSFEAGEEATLELSATREAWMYVANVTADDKATLLLPNRWQPEHRYVGKPIVFPAPDCGLCLEMQPLPDEPETAEAFLIVAFSEETALAEAFEPGQPYPLSVFYRKLTAFPLEKAAVLMLPYTVNAVRTP